MTKKILNTTVNILTCLLLVVAIGMVLFTVVATQTFNQSDRRLFGYTALIVQGDSMSKTDFKAGDLILVKEIDSSKLNIGDIISYRSFDSENYGQIVTHKIRKIVTRQDGKLEFITYGTTTNANDKSAVAETQVLGKYHKTIPILGRFFAFLKTVPGYLICIFFPFTILIVMQIINFYQLFKQYKEEQLANSEAEKKALEEEVARLREQLQKEQGQIE